MLALAVILIGSALLLLCIGWWYRRVSSKLGPIGEEALGWWDALPPDQCRQKLLQAAEAHPENGLVWYLLGMSHLAAGDVSRAVRAFQVSYHRQPAFETAALLVFAGQDLPSNDVDQLLPRVVETWQEMRRPRLERDPRERRLLDRLRLDQGAPPDVSSRLARTLWRLPLPQLREQLVRTLSDPRPQAWSAPLFEGS
jgi:hypothetical protein